MEESGRKGWIVVGVVVVLLFLVFLWPGYTMFAVLSASNGQALLRVNKVTGKATMVANTFPAPPAAPIPPAAAPQAPVAPTQ